MKTKILLLLLLPILMIASCKKDKSKIDAGFRCKLNGKTWFPDSDGDIKLRSTEAHLQNDGKEVFIQAKNARTQENISFGVYTEGVNIKVGSYILNRTSIQRGSYSKNDFKGEYYTTAGYEGVLEITKVDTEKKRISGTFYFNAYNTTTNNAVSITDGSFDLAYSTY